MTGVDERRLMHAARVGNKDGVMRLLVEDGVNVNCKDDMGYTALMWAAYYNRLEVAEVLLYYVANLNAKSNGGHTPVHIAVAKGGIDCLTLFCKAGANLTLRSNTGALHEGSLSGKVDCVRLLLEYKVPLRFTPLHLAASKGNFDICQMLLDTGAAIEFADSAGRTPLHLAASCPQGKLVVDLLLARGANATKKCLKNRTAMQHAVENNCTVTIPVLQMAESGSLGPIRRASMDVSESKSIYNKLPEKENADKSNSPPLPTKPSTPRATSPTGPTIIISPNLGMPPNYIHRDSTSPPSFPSSSSSSSPIVMSPSSSTSPPFSPSSPTSPPFSPRYGNEESGRNWRDLEQELAKQTQLIEQLRTEKAESEAKHVKSQTQLAQEIRKMEEKLRNTILDLEHVRTEKKNIAQDLDTTRKKFDVLSSELRTATQRYTLLSAHVAEVEESRLCKICFEKPITTVLAPCSHCCLCTDCTKAVQMKNKKCPICRTEITKTTVCFFT